LTQEGFIAINKVVLNVIAGRYIQSSPPPLSPGGGTGKGAVRINIMNLAAERLENAGQ
jgi:hypothetical protein